MRSNKYHAKKIRTADGVFDSRKEYNRWIELKLAERAGLITDLQRQVPYILIPKQKLETTRSSLTGSRTIRAEKEVKYIADFVYTENEKLIVEDAKGMRTQEYIIKRKLMKYVHGIEIKEV